MAHLEFTANEATAHRAIVVSFDLDGFSEFCNQPEASISAPRLIKRVFDILNSHFYEAKGSSLLSVSDKAGRIQTPDFITFTGDGAIMIWALNDTGDFPQSFCDLVVSTMRHFQITLAQDLPLREKEWRVQKLPKRARFGIAAGIAYALRPPHVFKSLTTPMSYIGYCLNLSVALQNHCPELGFLIHGALHPSIPGISRYEAVKMKAGQNVPVALFQDDEAQLTQAKFRERFKRSSKHS